MDCNTLLISHLFKSYINDHREQTVLSDVNLSLNSGQIVGLLGRNGAGKTTLIKSCIDLLTYKGKIYYLGHDLQKLTHSKKVQYFSALLEGNRNIYWKLTPIENFKFWTGLRGMKYKNISPIVDYLLKELYLYDKKNVLVENLSRGMQQKTALISTLVLDTPVIFLDEPTLGLDIESKNHMIEFFHNNDYIKNKLIIITSHDLEFIEKVTDRVYCIKDKQLTTYSSCSTISKNIYSFKIFGDNYQFISTYSGVSEISIKENIIKFKIQIEKLANFVNILESENFKVLSIEDLDLSIENFYFN